MTRTKHKKITALIPCYNEESGIADVISAFPVEKILSHGYELEVVVIDNASTDETADIARSLGATVLSEPKKGKGNAIRAGFNSIGKDTDYVVMLDGDNTYRPQEILRLIEPLNSGFCDVVIGSRLAGYISPGSMNMLNRAGNWIFSHLVRYMYRVNVTDALTGYFAWTREAIENLRPHLVSQGFAIEMEMVTKMAILGEEIYSVPISYDSRAGESNLRPFYDGSRILLMLVRNFSWQPLETKPQRIAFVSDSLMPYFHGGKERRLYEISRRLVHQNCEVHIYTMQWWEGPKVIQDSDGVWLHAICKLYPLYINDRRSILEAVMFGFATFKLMFERFDALDVDHMPYFPLMSARIVAWLRGKKLYATWHEVWSKEYWMEYLNGPLGLIGYAIERFSLYLPDVIIANSVHTTKRLRAAGYKREIFTIPLGVDLKKIYTTKAGTETSDVIFIGRLLEHKNVDLLVSAIAIAKQSFPTIMCNIVGDGPENVKIEALIEKLHLKKNIQIIGRVEGNSKLYALMKGSKMLVLPSVREGFGLVVIEANAAGIPVITTRHEDNAAQELVSEGVNGLLTEPTAEAISEKIIELMRGQTQMQPRNDIGKYDWNIVAQNLEKVLGMTRVLELE